MILTPSGKVANATITQRYVVIGKHWMTKKWKQHFFRHHLFLLLQHLLPRMKKEINKRVVEMLERKLG